MLRRPIRWLVRSALSLTSISVIVFSSDSKYDFSPSTVQRKLSFHPDDPILTDIEIRECGWSKKCDPLTPDGKVRFHKDSMSSRSWIGKSSAYVYTRQVNETESLPTDQVVLDIAIGLYDPHDPQAELPREVYDDSLPTVASDLELADPTRAVEMAGKAGWKSQNADYGLWVKRGKHVPNSAVSVINVFYGEAVDYPVDGWKLTDAMPIGPYRTNLDARAEFAPRIAFKTGRKATTLPPLAPLKFRKDGRFRIIQLADSHMSTGNGVCDQPAYPQEDCNADGLTMAFVNSVLDTENPDFIVFTGDQIFGDSSPDPETALMKAVAPVSRRKSPFSMVWGNHDDQGPYDRHQLMRFIRQSPNAHIFDPDPSVSGVGNYAVDVLAANSNSYPASTMYFLDSLTKIKTAKINAYDSIGPDQHELMRDSHDEQLAKSRGYAHIPSSMAFFHIPSPEYRGGRPEIQWSGKQRENVIAQGYNTGTMQVLQEIGVSVVSVGHDHANDFCMPSPESHQFEHRAWLCYGGGAGFGGYGGYPDESGPYKRRIRIFEVNMDVPSIDTWHRVERSAEKTDQSRLVDNGVAVFPFEG